MALKKYSQPSHCQEQNFCSHKSKKMEEMISNPLRNWCQSCFMAYCDKCILDHQH